MDKQYFIKSGYVSRPHPEYFDDKLDQTKDVTHQPDVYPFVAFLGRRFGCTHIIDIGCGQARKLASLHPEFKLIGIDFGVNIQYCRDHYEFGQWIEFDLESADQLPIDQDVVKNSIIICADVIEHLISPEHLLQNIKKLMKDAPAGVLTTPERDLTHSIDHVGPPLNRHHVREWNLNELVPFVQSIGLKVGFRGLTFSNDKYRQKKTSLLILSNEIHPLPSASDECLKDLRIVALIAAYNEADIILPCIKNLHNQGIEVYIIDNWSTDGTYEIAQSMLGQGVIGLERYPDNPEAGTHLYSWKKLLRRKAEIGYNLQADWYIHHDVDEYRETCWPDISLREGIHYVDLLGYNCIDSIVIEFKPIDNNYEPNTDHVAYFDHFNFSTNPGNTKQISIWKNPGTPVDLASSGGHHVRFDDQRLFPFKFIYRHYPFRNETQATNKIRAKQENSDARERMRGWHYMYEHLNISDEQLFENQCQEVRDNYHVFDRDTFYECYLVERLSGIGISQIPVQRKSKWRRMFDLIVISTKRWMNKHIGAQSIS